MRVRVTGFVRLPPMPAEWPPTEPSAAVVAYQYTRQAEVECANELTVVVRYLDDNTLEEVTAERVVWRDASPLPH